MKLLVAEVVVTVLPARLITPPYVLPASSDVMRPLARTMGRVIDSNAPVAPLTNVPPESVSVAYDRYMASYTVVRSVAPLLTVMGLLSIVPTALLL